MRLQVLLHPQLRTTLPECAQRNLRRSVWVRFKSQIPRPSQKHLSPLPRSKETLPATRSPVTRTLTPPKTTTRTGPPERILVYYGGTGRAVFLGTLRITTVLLFGAACLIVAPACSVANDYPWYSTPAVIVAGALPMLFVSYTAAPYVNFIHLALPAFARKSREAAVQYAKDLPPTAVLYLTSMRFNTIPRQTTARLGDLVPLKDTLRPVTFQNLKPSPQRWWQGRAPTQFYTGSHSKPGRQTSAFFPDLWNGIYQQIQKAKSQPHQSHRYP
ncbi:60S ribosomal protein L6-1 [Penicillium digitatum]|uniref:60S ribosomal protein L6-1 n=1 Tax=Penicillium digitatum TaxID=36651 RepID=A0A7T7BHB1_PENDI|nr:60S ribosomal protein L6-1 [Penicillium digitatum]